MIRRVAFILLAAVLLAAPAAEARPAGLAKTAMVKKKLTCKQVKRARATRKMTKAKRKHLAALKRRCAAAQRKQSSGGSAPSAPAGGPAVPGASGTGTPSPAAPPEPDPGDYTAPLPESNPRALQVISGEFFLNLSKGAVLSGPVRVEFNNAYAEDPHDLHLVREGSSGQNYAFGQLEAGQIEAKTLDLSKGTWQLFCALPEHASRGMTATLKVSD